VTILSHIKNTSKTYSFCLKYKLNRFIKDIQFFMKFNKIILVFLLPFVLSACEAMKFKKVDAKQFPPDPKERVKNNMEEGRGFRLLGGPNNGTTYSFATSNPLWRATLDTLDFMPLVSANYSGGIIVTDWYSENNVPEESIKISVRFLTNDIRSDALDINVFYKECSKNLSNCKINQKNNQLTSQLASSILKKASQYERARIEKNKKENPYTISTPTKEMDKKKN